MYLQYKNCLGEGCRWNETNPGTYSYMNQLCNKEQFTQKYITASLVIRQVYTFNGDRLLHWNSYENIMFTESSVIGIFMASHYYLIELYLG